jgi:hypothetical protein
MDTVILPPRRVSHPALVSFLFHDNPFYLLSALCMIAGCYLLNSGLALHPGDLPRLLLLVGTLNVYEALLIALGLYLIHGRGVLRDGRTLLLLEAPFLVDLAFLNAEMAQVHGPAGLCLNALMLALALLKIAIILRVLFGAMPRRVFSVIGLELLFLFALPSVFKQIAHNGSLTNGQFYATWFLVALVPVIYETQSRIFDPSASTDDAGPLAFIRRLYLTLPFISLLAHLGMLHWVYNVDFHLADGALVVLGLSIPLARLQPQTPIANDVLRLLRCGLPAAAIVMSCMDSPAISWPLGPRLTLTPIMFTLAGAYLAYVYLYFWPYALYCLSGAMAGVLVIMFGPTPWQIYLAFVHCARRFTALLNWLMPSTLLQWGAVAIGAAFAFLGIGASISLRRPREDPPPIPLAQKS